MSIHSVNTSCARAGVIMPSRYSLAKGASRNSASASAVLILHFPLELGSVKRFGLAALLTLNQGRPQGFELAMLAGLVRPDHIEHIALSSPWALLGFISFVRRNLIRAPD